MRGRVNSVVFSSGGDVPDGKTVTPVNDVEIWQQCAGIANPTYTTLSGVLSDNSLLITLMASNNAVDYMVRSTDWATEQALVPAMTSATTPSGTVTSSGEWDSSKAAYRAFDGNSSNEWQSNVSSTPWIQYAFPDDVEVYSFAVESIQSSMSVFGTYKGKLQYSTDGSAFVDVSNELSVPVRSTTQKGTVTSFYSGKYWRLQTTQNNYVDSGQNRTILTGIQFYSAAIPLNANAMTAIGLYNYCANTLLADETWCNAICNSAYFESVLNAKVPTMTSGTAPSGRVLVSSEGSQTYEKGYLAFSDASGYWASTGGATQYIGYMFTSAVSVHKVTYLNRPSIAGPKVAKFQVSADGTTWTDIGDFPNCSTANTTYTATYTNSTKCAYFRIYITQSNYTYASIQYSLAQRIQFYGRSDV